MMYTSPKRVIRDGRVVAFKGQCMSVAEAKRRGLLAEKVGAVTGIPRGEGVEVPADGVKREHTLTPAPHPRMKKAELLEIALERGLDASEENTKPQLIAMLLG